MVVETEITPYHIWPLLVTIGTAAWFGAIGWRKRQAKAFWVTGGAVLGLVISVISSSLANAVALPDTEPVIRKGQSIAFAIAVLIIVIIGLLLGFFTGQTSPSPNGSERPPG